MNRGAVGPLGYGAVGPWGRSAMARWGGGAVGRCGGVAVWQWGGGASNNTCSETCNISVVIHKCYYVIMTFEIMSVAIE